MIKAKPHEDQFTRLRKERLNKTLALRKKYLIQKLPKDNSLFSSKNTPTKNRIRRILNCYTLKGTERSPVKKKDRELTYTSVINEITS